MPTNTAKVPHRSPLRYPGGKTWLTPQIRAWLTTTRPTVLVDAFTGGGSVALCAAAENLVEQVVLVELDTQVAAVWDTIINGDAHALADQVRHFTLTAQSFTDLLATPATTSAEQALVTIVTNRVRHGGILTARAGILRAGERGRGLTSRWYPDTIADRIEKIAALAPRLHLHHADALTVLPHYARPDVAVFADPPYTAGGTNAGARLYTHHTVDHPALFATLASHPGPVLATYDDNPAVRDLAAAHQLATRPIAMATTHHRVRTELLIGRDLTWAAG